MFERPRAQRRAASPTTAPTRAPTTAPAGSRARRPTSSSDLLEATAEREPASWTSTSGIPRRSCATGTPRRRAPTAHQEPARHERRRRAARGAARPRPATAARGWSRGRRARACCSTGAPVLLLCSNNYLGFAEHPRVREAAADAAMRWGVGAGASRLVSGTMTIHERLEHPLAEFEGTEACVLFGSGYLANIGVSRRLGRGATTIFSDELNHASIVDGCRLRARRRSSTATATSSTSRGALRERRRRGRGDRDRLGLLDGRRRRAAREIVELARRHGALVVVDEAHATGALGPGGRGAIAEAGLEGEVDVLVGTLSKALGSYGGYVCARRRDRRAARQQRAGADLLDRAAAARPSPAPTPRSSSSVEQPRRPEKLRSAPPRCCGASSRRLAPVPARTQIVPVIVGDADRRGAPLGGGAGARRVRPGDPPADGARGQLAPAPGVMASHTARAELAAAPRAAITARASRGTLRGSRAPRARRSRRAPPSCAAASSPAPTPVSARPSSPPRWSPPARARRAVAARKPVSTGLDEPPAGVADGRPSCSR